MINFTYNKKIEDSIFNDYVLEKKSPVVSQIISNELQTVNIDISDRYIKEHIDFISRQWIKAQPKFLKALGDFYEKELPEPDLICYLTRLDIFPYQYEPEKDGDHWFSAPLFSNPTERNRVIMHELCHYYQPQPLPREIKEAIPEILNDHDTFGMYSFDRGHKDENEQRWRKVIRELYKDGGKFSDLLKLVK